MLSLLSKLFPRKTSWSLKVSDNDNCDSSMTAPLAGTRINPFGGAYELTAPNMVTFPNENVFIVLYLCISANLVHLHFAVKCASKI